MYEKLVKEVKVIARDILRGKLVSARLSKIATIEGYAKDRAERLEALEKSLARLVFAKSQLVEADPDFEDRNKSVDENIKYAKAEIEAYKKSSVEADENDKRAIAEHKEGIADITSGKTLVSADELNALVAELLVEAGKEKVRNL